MTRKSKHKILLDLYNWGMIYIRHFKTEFIQHDNKISVRLSYSIVRIYLVPPYLLLAIAIVAEVIATSAMKASQNFTVLIPSIISVVGYLIAFACLSFTLKSIPVGIAYAIWSGAGIILISAVGWIFFKQQLDFAAILGLSLMIIGILIINIFSKSSHL